MIARATGPGAARAGFGTGTATGPLNNLDAILTHARNLMPSFKSDLQRMFDEGADKATRIGAGLAFGVKIGAVSALGYFVYIEAIEFRARALTSWAQSCIERQKNAVAHMSLNQLMQAPWIDGDEECGRQPK